MLGLQTRNRGQSFKMHSKEKITIALFSLTIMESINLALLCVVHWIITFLID